MKRKSKSKSTSFWFSAWAAALVTYIVFKVADFQFPWVGGLVIGLLSIITANVVGNKSVDYKHGPEMEDDKRD
jgi:hypothetical protein